MLASRSCSIAGRLALALVAVAALVAAAPSLARAAEPGVAVHPADAGVDWLVAELAANDGAFPSSFGGGAKDWGLTIDAILALVAGGRGDGDEVAQAVAALDADLASYVTGGEFGPDERYANALAKALLLEQVADVDLGGAFDVEAELRALEVPDGDQAGRLADASEFGDFSNGIGHALAIMALGDTPGGVPAGVVDFFLGQQCPAGGFRLYYEGYPLAYDPEPPFDPIEVVEDVTCTTDDQIDLDATAFAVQALLVAPPSPGVASALDAATAHLLAAQEDDGGFVGTGALNTNTSGLAGAALRAAGQTAAADAAAGFVATLQQVGACTDFGAIAYDATSFAAGVEADRPQWVRASAQAVFGLGLPAYGDIGVVAPVPAGLADVACPAVPVDPEDPTAPGAPAITLTSPKVTAGGAVAGFATGFEPGEDVVGTLHSLPVVLGTVVADAEGRVTFSFVVPSDVEPGVHRLELVGQTSGRTASVEVEVLGVVVTGALPATGASTGTQALAGALVVVTGVALVRAGDRLQRLREHRSAA